MTKKWCGEGLGAKPSHLGFGSNFGGLSYHNAWNFG